MINKIMKILVCDKTEEEILERIKELGNVVYQPEDLLKEVKEAEIMVVRSKTKVTKEVIDNAEKLKLIIRAGIGLDNVDLEYCKKKKIEVKNTPGLSTNAVAELVIGNIIALMRGTYRGHEEMKKGNWVKKELVGKEIEGKTLGIIGCGRIGHLVSEKASKLGMKILGCDPHPRENKIIKFVGLDELYKNSDVITLHTILTPESKEMINKKSIGKMKDGIYIINLARGELINENDLFDALNKGKVAAVSLDVYEKEPYTGKLLKLNNVLFTPHIGGSTKEAQMRIGEEVIKIIKENI